MPCDSIVIGQDTKSGSRACHDDKQTRGCRHVATAESKQKVLFLCVYSVKGTCSCLEGISWVLLAFYQGSFLFVAVKESGSGPADQGSSQGNKEYLNLGKLDL
jgi:hypothetical protein